MLVFFNRGANIHIIDGSLAEKEGLQQVSSSSMSLTVVGGDKIVSDHGTFRFNLGPGDNDEFHEIVCVGLSDVTAGFGSYDLSEISREYRAQCEPEQKDVILPMKVGGSKVQLLLGIKNTKLDLVLIQILPSGVAVYRSPFKDVFGSRIIFGGPHKSFTKNDTGEKMSNAVFLLNAQVPSQQQLRDDLGNSEVDFIDFSVAVADAGKGLAEELLIDLKFSSTGRKIAEKPLIDLEMNSAEQERFRFQSCLNKARYLETLEEESVMDMDITDENEDIVNPETC